MLSKTLQELRERGKPVKIGLIGGGRFGSMVTSQVNRVEGMVMAGIADLRLESAIANYMCCGYAKDQIMEVDDSSAANHYMEKSVPVVTRNGEVLTKSDVDIIVEATGNLEAGARVAYEAIKNRKDVVMVNVETDITIGPLLKKMADEKGVVYSLAYGDQPALIIDMYDWAVSSGFRVVAAGEGTAYRPSFAKMTPKDSLIRFGFTQKKIKELAKAGVPLNAQMYNSFLDGVKCAVEMTAVSNATGLVPDIRGMHRPTAGVREIPEKLSLKQDGGILGREGVVEAVVHFNPDGSMIQDHLRWGIFVVITSDDPYIRSCMQDYGMLMGGRGKNGLMYRPFHLIGMETPYTIARIAIQREPTGAPLEAPVSEVIAAAKKPLKPGTVLDGGGGYTAYGLVEKAEIAKEERLIPFELAVGAKVLRDIPEDGVITYDDVELREDSFALELRRQQDSVFH